MSSIVLEKVSKIQINVDNPQTNIHDSLGLSRKMSLLSDLLRLLLILMIGK